MFKRILVALDGSDHAYKALDIGAGLAAREGAELILLHVASDKPLSEGERHMAMAEYTGEFAKELDVEALMAVRGEPRVVAGELLEQYGQAGRRIRAAVGHGILDRARKRAHELGAETVRERLEEGDPARTIMAVAGDEDADLLVLGGRGRGDLAGLLLGSVSHKVSHLATCSCVVVK